MGMVSTLYDFLSIKEGCKRSKKDIKALKAKMEQREKEEEIGSVDEDEDGVDTVPIAD